MQIGGVALRDFSQDARAVGCIGKVQGLGLQALESVGGELLEIPTLTTDE